MTARQIQIMKLWSGLPQQNKNLAKSVYGLVYKYTVLLTISPKGSLKTGTICFSEIRASKWVLGFGCKIQGQCLCLFDAKDSQGNFWIHWGVVITNAGIFMARLCSIGCFAMLSLFWAHCDLQYMFIISHPAFWTACIGRKTNFISLINYINQTFQAFH